MRRFVDTFAGKAMCHLAVMALVLPTVTLTVARRAEAQVTQLPSWAVTEFKDLKGNASLKYGQTAADAVASELAKTNRYDVVPQESVKRSIETLGLSSPLDGLVNLERVGQDVRASTIVQGEVIDYRVKESGGGKQAIVAVRLVAYDVISGLPVNGALEKGESTIRSGNVTNETLINDAIQQAAAVAVRTMQGQQLPSATVLNTTTRTALLNQGTRSGFKSGDTVILTRGNIQVGTGRIGQIEPDQAEMTFERISVGVAPGDRVRAVFSPPALPAGGVSVFTDKNDLRVSSKPRGRSNNATLVSALLVVGLVAVLLGSGGNSNSTSATSSVVAEATLDNGSPAVRIHWSPNGFFKGSGTSGNGRARWQIYRSDSLANPALVIQGTENSVVDSSATMNDEFPLEYFRGGANATGQIGGSTCDNTTPSNLTRAAETQIVKTGGTPYQYFVECVYFVSSLDLPNGSTGSTNTTGSSTGTTAGGTTTSGTTGTTTTAGGTTGTTGVTTGGTTGTSTAGTTSTATTSATTGTTSTAGTTAGGSTSGSSGTVENCYFQSGRSHSGFATPLARPVLTTPLGVSTATATFGFTSTVNTAAGVLQSTILEVSDDFNFNKKYTASVTSSSPNVLSVVTNLGGAPFNAKKGIGGALLSQTPFLYYRIGVRNLNDSPGPVADQASGKRYIYSVVGNFTRIINTSGASSVRKSP